MKGALSYNENKVRQGTAEIITASGFGCEIDHLGFSQKLKRFEQLNQNSTKVSNNTLHISLNFLPGEHLTTETLQNIARDYMERIGFSHQPFLVYRHDDAAHPHIHIITTPIKPNGKSINLHNIAKRLSEPARKEIETGYGLVVAESRKQNKMFVLQPSPTQAAFYGRSETKQIISNIVLDVVARYQFTSLDHFNAVLRQFNVVADRGSHNSRMHQAGGLVYSIIDKDGYKTGIPIKASAIYSTPTLAALEKKFEKNRVTASRHQKVMQAKMNSILANVQTIDGFMAALKQNRIGCSVLYGRDNNVANISFVDHANKSVFSCLELGYSVPSLLGHLHHAHTTDRNNGHPYPLYDFGRDEQLFSADSEILKSLLITEAYQPDLSPEFLKKKRKKRKH